MQGGAWGRLGKERGSWQLRKADLQPVWRTPWAVQGWAKGLGMGRWLIGESPTASACSCSLWGRVARRDTASGQLGL